MKKSIKADINALLKRPCAFFEKYHMFSSIDSESSTERNLVDPAVWEKIYYKGYSRFKSIRLLKPSIRKVLLVSVLQNRKSNRFFSNKKLSLKKIGSLLYYSFGINAKREGYLRFYPSAGYRFPLEIYILSLDTDLPKGVYHYYLKDHSLEKLYNIDIKVDDYFSQKWINKAKAIVVITGVFKRMTIKYGERGYRFTLMEAGHAGQNVYLLASALKLDCCAIGGFDDKRLSILLDIDGISEAPLYAFAIG